MVCGQFANQWIELLLPTLKHLSQRKDRKKESELLLFSGYRFVWFAPEQKLAVRKVSGVVEIVGGGNRPEPILDEEIAVLQVLLRSVLPYDLHPYLHEGMLAEVVRGPMRGAHGILLRKQKRHRLVIGVHLIQ